MFSYPQCLHHLELLQHADFRADLKKDEYLRDLLHQKQFDHWYEARLSVIQRDLTFFLGEHGKSSFHFIYCGNNEIY